MARLFNLARFIKSPKEPVQGYKYRHFLNTLPAHKIKEMLVFSEGDTLCEVLPALQKRKSLVFNDQEHKFVFKKITAQEPDYLINYVYRGDSVLAQVPSFYTMLGDLERFALKSDHFDVVVGPFATDSTRVSLKLVKGFSRVLRNGGRLVLSLRHPQLEHLLYNQNPSEVGSPQNSVSGYFNAFKENHLFVEEMREGVVNAALKPFFTREGEYDHYHEYQGTPLTLVFRAVKFVRPKR